MPLVSFVVPIHNTAKYLKTCLDSVMNQTIESFETIMVDDGSTDNSADIARAYLSDFRFKYIYQENQGVSAARNLGIKLAEGDWIVFLDSDDSLKQEFLSELLETAKETHAEIVACCANYEKKEVLSQIHFWDSTSVFSDLGSETVSKKELYLQLMNPGYKTDPPGITAIGVPWGKIYKRDLLIQNGILFDTNLRRLQDNIFNMYAFEAAHKIAYIDRPLYNYTLDHIHNFHYKYQETAPLNYENVIRQRKSFLTNSGLFADTQVQDFYYQEVIRMIDKMLCGYYLNPKNPKTKTKILAEMKIKFRDPLYTEAMEKGFSKIQSFRIKTYIYMLRNNKYEGLWTLNSFVRKYLKR